MASRILLSPALRPFRLSGPQVICASSILAYPLIVWRWQKPMLMDSFSSAPSLQSYGDNAKTPIVKNGRLNENAIRQVSAGSILGLVGGVAVSFFSKPLALLIGLLVFGVQALESRGIHLIPYGRLQQSFKNFNITSAVRDNVAFKLSFGATFALAAFAQF